MFRFSIAAASLCLALAPPAALAGKQLDLVKKKLLEKRKVVEKLQKEKGIDDKDREIMTQAFKTSAFASFSKSEYTTENVPAFLVIEKLRNALKLSAFLEFVTTHIGLKEGDKPELELNLAGDLVLAVRKLTGVIAKKESVSTTTLKSVIGEIYKAVVLNMTDTYMRFRTTDAGLDWRLSYAKKAKKKN